MTLWLWASSSRSWWSLPRSSGRWSSCGKCWAEELGIAYRSGVAVSYSPCLVRSLVRCGPLPHQTVSLVLASAVPERARLSREIQSEACDGAQTVHWRPALFDVERSASRGVRAGGGGGIGDGRDGARHGSLAGFRLRRDDDGRGGGGGGQEVQRPGHGWPDAGGGTPQCLRP